MKSKLTLLALAAFAVTTSASAVPTCPTTALNAATALEKLHPLKGKNVRFSDNVAIVSGGTPSEAFNVSEVVFVADAQAGMTGTPAHTYTVKMNPTNCRVMAVSLEIFSGFANR